MLVLASQSPRRRELLRQIGVRHRVAVPSVEERQHEGELASDCVARLALEKARQVWDAAPRGGSAPPLPVLGADTAVVIDEQMLGKPGDRDEALAMLARLSGRAHRVLTAVALLTEDGSAVRLSDSEVRFRRIDSRECAAYWDSGEPRDKAGGYAIQGYGAVFVAGLRGSYSGVMGLPLFETCALLDAAGVPRWRSAGAGAG